MRWRGAAAEQCSTAGCHCSLHHWTQGGQNDQKAFWKSPPPLRKAVTASTFLNATINVSLYLKAPGHSGTLSSGCNCFKCTPCIHCMLQENTAWHLHVCTSPKHCILWELELQKSFKQFCSICSFVISPGMHHEQQQHDSELLQNNRNTGFLCYREIWTWIMQKRCVKSLCKQLNFCGMKWNVTQLTCSYFWKMFQCYYLTSAIQPCELCWNFFPSASAQQGRHLTALQCYSSVSADPPTVGGSPKKTG